MKIEYICEYNFYIYLNKYYIHDLELDNKSCVEEYFKKIFLNLKNNYHMNIYGYYNINVYANKNYGVIIDVFKLSNDYFKMPNNKVDMKIIIENDSVFLYEIDNYFVIDKYRDQIKDIYYEGNMFYIELKEEVDRDFYFSLIEHSNIVFGDKVLNIISTSVKL